MSKSELLIYGYDFITTTGTVNNDTKITIKSVATESISSEVPSDSQVAVQYFINGLNKDLARDLKEGLSYIVFEIEAINHTTKTANGRLYPKIPFRDALTDYSFQNKLRLGGVGGICPYIS